MPYEIRGQYVYNTETGERKNTKPLSHERLVRYMRALYAVEKKSMATEDVLIAEKAANVHARAGETIAGNLVRGADGKFTSAGHATASSKRPTSKPARAPRAGRSKLDALKKKLAALRTPKGGKRAAKPKKSDAEKKAATEAKRRERQIQQQQNRDARDRARSIKRQLVAEKLRAAVQKRQQRATERKQALLERMQQAIAGKLSKRSSAASPKGGGSKSSQKKPASARPSIAPELMTLAGRLSRGDTLSEAEQTTLIRNGLARRDRHGTLILSAFGLRNAKKDYLPGSLTVYKDDGGGWRWIGVSSTAFRDREGEIVSTAALEQDVARSYQAIADGLAPDHGPLRFWHVPGLDIGRCDFRMVHGHSLIEGGPLLSEKEAALIQPGDQMSLAFAYAPQALHGGVFSAIVSFERSITPAGRAANPYTAIVMEAEA